MTKDAKYQLSLFSVVLISINVILGAGVFINTKPLVEEIGFLGGFCYILVGILIIPLVLSFAKLARKYPTGGFYVYGAKEVGPSLGFACTWTYLAGKLASGTLMIHTFSMMIHKILPLSVNLSLIHLDLIVLGLFFVFNLLNMRMGSHIQLGFMIMKLIPLVFMVFSGFYLWSEMPVKQGMTALPWAAIPKTIPAVVFVFTGLEVCCTLSMRMKNPEKNVTKALMIAFSTVCLVIFTYQMFAFLHATRLNVPLGDSFDIFSLIVNSDFFSSLGPKLVLEKVLYIGIAFSAFGGGYGILYSNIWNFYNLAKHGHLISKKSVLKENKHQIPYFCLIAEVIVCTIYILFATGNIFDLQLLGTLGMSLGYGLVVLSLFLGGLVNKKEKKTLSVIGFLGLVSCTFIVSVSLKNLAKAGIAFTLLALGMAVLGIVFYQVSKRNTKTLT
jgi:amino acid transporter